MLQALLEDRFKLKIHRESREVAVYALTVAKGGPKLKPFKEGSCTPVDLANPAPPLSPGQPIPLLCGMVRGTDRGYDAPGLNDGGLLQLLLELVVCVVNSNYYC